jgi:hypothetical protein
MGEGENSGHFPFVDALSAAGHTFAFRRFARSAACLLNPIGFSKNDGRFGFREREKKQKQMQSTGLKIFMANRHYQLVAYDQKKTITRVATDPATLLMNLLTHVKFWATFVQQCRRTETSIGNIDAVTCAILGRVRFERSFDAVLEDDFSVLRGDVPRVQDIEGGLLTLAHAHLRLSQLQEVHKAVDGLCRFDPRIALRDIAFSTDSGRELLAQQIKVFFEEMLTRAFGALWLLKTSERLKPVSERKRDELGLLWTALLKLRALALLDGEALATVCFQDMVNAGLWRAEQALVFDVNLPVFEYTFNEFWQTLVTFSWDWPSWTIGPVVARFMDALWWRCATFVSQGFEADGSSPIPDHPLFLRQVKRSQSGAAVYVPSDHFVLETERSFFYLFDGLWAFQWFNARLTREAAAEAQDTSVERARSAQWEELVQKSIVGQLSDWVKREFSRILWRFHARRDEAERYNEDTSTTQGNPAKSILRYHRSDYDLILTVSNSLPSAVWTPACQTVDADLKQAAALEGRALLSAEEKKSSIRGLDYAWRSIPVLWQTHMQKTIGTGSANNKGGVTVERVRTGPDEDDNFRVRVLPTGEKQYLDKTGRRLYGEARMRAALLHAARTMKAGKQEHDAISEATLLVKMQASAEREDTTKVRIWSDCDFPERFSLFHLPDRHVALAQQQQRPTSAFKFRMPCLLRLANQYLVFDGEYTLVQTPLLCRALEVWATKVDDLIELSLVDLGQAAETVMRALELTQANDDKVRETITSLHSKAAALVSHMPSALRPVFGLERDPLTLRRLSRTSSGGGTSPLNLDESAEIAPDSSSKRRHWLGPRLARALIAHQIILSDQYSLVDQTRLRATEQAWAERRRQEELLVQPSDPSAMREPVDDEDEEAHHDPGALDEPEEEDVRAPGGQPHDEDAMDLDTSPPPLPPSEPVIQW